LDVVAQSIPAGRFSRCAIRIAIGPEESILFSIRGDRPKTFEKSESRSWVALRTGPGSVALSTIVTELLIASGDDALTGSCASALVADAALKSALTTTISNLEWKQSEITWVSFGEKRQGPPWFARAGGKIAAIFYLQQIDLVDGRG
jgi:hypothetical protein